MERKLYPNYRFKVIIFYGGVVPDLFLDVRFQKVSGLDVEIETEEFREGGENLYERQMPGRAKYENLVLERGMVVVSPLNIQLNIAMSSLKLSANNIFVTLLDDEGTVVPGAAWLFAGAYPVKWSASELDASGSDIMVDTMEFAHNGFVSLRI